jgi:sulfopyruvate decarboxylase subunit alpha
VATAGESITRVTRDQALRTGARPHHRPVVRLLPGRYHPETLARLSTQGRAGMVAVVEGSTDQVLAGLKEAGIDFVASLPSKSIAPAVRAVAFDPDFTHVPVAHEGDAIGICAGAAMTGKKPAILMQNCGLVMASYALLDTLYWFGGFPIVMVMDHRGSFGDDGGFIFHGYGVHVPRLLDAYEIPYRVVEDVDEVAAAIVAAATSAQASGKPAAVLLTGDAL